MLIADDEEADRFLFGRAFSDALGEAGSVNVVGDGEEAIRYLAGEGPFGDRERYPFPSLVLLDLKMVRVDGLRVLEFMRHNPAWNVIPRIIFSSSTDYDDIKKAYLVGATVYHRKPSNQQELEDLARLIVTYWRTCEVPPMDRTGRLLITDSRGKIGERIPQPEGGEHMERLE